MLPALNRVEEALKRLRERQLFRLLENAAIIGGVIAVAVVGIMWPFEHLFAWWVMGMTGAVMSLTMLCVAIADRVRLHNQRADHPIGERLAMWATTRRGDAHGEFVLDISVSNLSPFPLTVCSGGSITLQAQSPESPAGHTWRDRTLTGPTRIKARWDGGHQFVDLPPIIIMDSQFQAGHTYEFLLTGVIYLDADGQTQVPCKVLIRFYSVVC